MAAVRILFIGAGAVNFGGAEGPWDHSRRLEGLQGVRIVGIADPDVLKAKAVLEKKANGKYGEVYGECAVYGDYKEAIKACKPDAAFIGIPPFCHGGVTPPLDVELQCLRAGLHIFVEKPISVLPPEEFSPYVDALEAAQSERGLVVSVGYMFRYHPAVDKMKSLLEQYGRRKPLAISARYNCAYSTMDHPFWWNKAQSGGPIVEQGTHFCDLLRYLGGEVREGTVSALSVEASDDPGDVGYLSAVKDVIRETEVPPSCRVPRLTNSHWRFTGGGVGTLTHGITIQGCKYETSIELWADGLRMHLEEPYFPECKLRVRDASSDTEQVYPFPDADPYLTEVECFLDAVRSGDPTRVKSSYRDASMTYNLSWAIRRASEKTAQIA